MQLLTAALYDERFPWLLHLDVYGAIIGMFELNNLGAVPTRHHVPHRLTPIIRLLCTWQAWKDWYLHRRQDCLPVLALAPFGFKNIAPPL